ncbi:carbohydrate ABC transporter permease [Paenibacillus prosopidis]|uniref:Multiple sugar transport system permease protein/putative aldouronate transport system permease protein n=1 Tax=Paenibacillus prosopidis TaxID=630520 RepID=A0A368W2F3_9BACL|nr:carbohydrate ABC transporter permease [Paenibacillus prosopidis]RCW48890.1 multiple sugar transport system permease protein/putative aldouronate transport system permease protein [Paenibacillus prosopidis]
MIKESSSDRLLKVIIYIVLSLFAIYCVIPFVTVISSSLSSESSILRDGYSIVPREFTLAAYNLIFKDDTIYRAYGVTIFVTVVGTAIAMLVTCALAYPLSIRALKYKNGINFYVYFTMLFHGGLVANYLLISKYLGMRDSIWVLIIPALVSPWNMFLMRNFFKSVDESLAESAKIDGANDIYIFYKIVLPISLPALATVGLFYAMAFWNKWFEAMLYISDENKFPLQYLVMRIMNNADFANQLSAKISLPNYVVPTLSTRLATTVVTIGPIIFLYPFLQKYFVKGLMVGAVKG